jgi:hypothetical protein
MIQNVVDSVRQARGQGYRRGASKQIEPGTKDKQIARIRSKALAQGFTDIPIWDRKGFNQRFGQSIANFLIWYRETPPVQRFVSEHIPPRRPCKLFYDVEYSKTFNDDNELIFKLTRVGHFTSTMLIGHLETASALG